MSNVRVISGSARGKKLLAPSGLATRPTADRVKEAVFSIITPYLPAQNVLDMFAGSGALGIEALSRGSKHAVFTEADKAALSVIRQNLDLARVGERAEVVAGDAFKYLSGTSLSFDVIFLDPPYNTGLLKKALTLIFERELLSDDGIVVVESELAGEEPEDSRFDIVKQAKYGKTVVFVLRLHRGKEGII